MKEHLKWIVTRWHFWVLVAAYFLFGIIRDYEEFGFSGPIIIGDFFGSFIFFFIPYAFFRGILWLAGKTKADK